MKAQFDAKPSEEQTLFAHFKYLDDQIEKINGSTLNPTSSDEVKNMLQDFEVNLLLDGAFRAEVRARLSAPPARPG